MHVLLLGIGRTGSASRIIATHVVWNKIMWHSFDRVEELALREAHGLRAASLSYAGEQVTGKRYCKEHQGENPRSELLSQLGMDLSLLPTQIMEETCTALAAFELPPAYPQLCVDDGRHRAVYTKSGHGNEATLLCTVAIVDTRDDSVLLHCRVDHNMSGSELLQKYGTSEWAPIMRRHIRSCYCNGDHPLATSTTRSLLIICTNMDLTQRR